MDDANDEHKSDQKRRRIIVIQWKREEGTPAPGEEDHALRGTVLDVFGRTRRVFAGMDSLFEILGEIMRDKPLRRPNWVSDEPWTRP